MSNILTYASRSLLSDLNFDKATRVASDTATALEHRVNQPTPEGAAPEIQPTASKPTLDELDARE